LSDLIVGWKVYTDIERGFQISYPSGWVVDQNIMADGSGNKFFCPPELCKIITLDGTLQSLAPIMLFITDSSGFEMPSNPERKPILFNSGKYYYELIYASHESTYQNIYEKMKESVKIIK